MHKFASFFNSRGGCCVLYVEVVVVRHTRARADTLIKSNGEAGRKRWRQQRWGSYRRRRRRIYLEKSGGWCVGSDPHAVCVCVCVSSGFVEWVGSNVQTFCEYLFGVKARQSVFCFVLPSALSVFNAVVIFCPKHHKRVCCGSQRWPSQLFSESTLRLKSVASCLRAKIKQTPPRKVCSSGARGGNSLGYVKRTERGIHTAHGSAAGP